MKTIWPDPKSNVDITQLYEIEKFEFANKQYQKTKRPWVTLNMISSINGVATSSGLSGELGSKGDKLIFNSLRASADFILLGAGTAKAEKYGMPNISEDAQIRRTSRGQTDIPRLVIISKRLEFDDDLKFLNALNDGASATPIIYTTQNAPAKNKTWLSERAEIREAGKENIDLAEVISDLKGKIILVEGGPTLNGHLLEADLIDELCLTLSPMIVNENGPHIISGDLKQPKNMKLIQVLADEDSMLYLRFKK